jgi:1,2-diacylglycerol 3-alpha-glucosyltransferase/glucuronosyltransferase
VTAGGTIPAGRFPIPGQEHLKVLIVTDAWRPQVNGVVTTLEMLGRELSALGHDVRYATPEGRFTLPLPTYPEIRLAFFPRSGLEKLFREFAPDAVHIATEGTMGLSARAICIKHGIDFTTAFHTRFPEYIHARFPFVPEKSVWQVEWWFHSKAIATMARTPTMKRELESHGFRHVRLWEGGVDVEHFRPIADATLPYPRPIFLYVGRVAIEKNIEAFLSLDLPGTKIVVGPGPARETLAKKYPEAKFFGPKTGEELVRIYAASDVNVFPSLTDTYGLVMLEALACGTPVATFPHAVMQDVVGGCKAAALDADLAAACRKALTLSRSEARAFALTRSCRASTLQFLDNLVVEQPQEA